MPTKDAVFMLGLHSFWPLRRRGQKLCSLLHCSLFSVTHHFCVGSLRGGGIHFLNLQAEPVGRLISSNTETPGALSGQKWCVCVCVCVWCVYVFVYGDRDLAQDPVHPRKASFPARISFVHSPEISARLFSQIDSSMH